MCTKEQESKILSIKREGYWWNKSLSISYAAIVFSKGNDLWVFGLDGSIMHNPNVIKIKL